MHMPARVAVTTKCLEASPLEIGEASEDTLAAERSRLQPYGMC